MSQSNGLAESDVMCRSVLVNPLKAIIFSNLDEVHAMASIIDVGPLYWVLVFVIGEPFAVV